MFRKLRIKFIAITMVMVAIVMAFAFTVVCVVEYQRSSSVVQTALDNAVQEAIVAVNRSKDHQGMMKEGFRKGPSSSSSSSSDEGQGQSSSASSQNSQPSLVKPERAYADEPQAGQGGSPDQGNGQQPGEGGQNGQNPGTAPQQAPGNDPGSNANANAQPGNPGGQAGSPPSPSGGSGDSTTSPADEAEESEQPSGNTVSKQSSAEGGNAPTGNAADDSDGGSSGEQGQADGGEGENRDSITISDEDMGQAAPPSIGNRPGQQRPSSSIVPVAVYRIDSNGTLRVVPEITTASISEDVLKEAADLALQAADGFGTFASLQLHYYKAESDGTTFLAFADTSYTDTWKSLALILTGSGVGTLAVFFVVALFYSRWALRPVKEAWDSQRQFVADASHDLKTPLTVILANAAILLKHPDHTIASESQWIESTQKEAEDMQGLVNEMLELAQIEAGQKADAVREPIDLSDLVDGETLLFDSVALERNCAFNCSIDEGVQVLGDEKQVKKLVSTLVENAFKYVDESGAIDIVMRRSGKVATIDIHNTGSTISAEDLPHIFDRFYRTDKARTSGTGGFGLGLAIAREIARQHGGDITCKSSETEGTTFTITLPLAA